MVSSPPGHGRTSSRASYEMHPRKRSQMDSLVQPLVAQYLAMGGQSKDNSANGNIPANEGKEKEHP